MSLPFLTARWSNLIVVNYKISPEALAPFVPSGTELDFHEGKTFVSLVAFRFLQNRFLGLIPAWPAYHFDEINLRFYLRAPHADGARKGVAFVKEFVPSRLVAATARGVYDEPYEAVPMFHDLSAFHPINGGKLTYGLKKGGETFQVTATTLGALQELQPGSLEEFILEHYWGYTARAEGITSEYEVRHPRWKVWSVGALEVSENFSRLYGERFEPFLKARPHSALVAQGSEVSVHAHRRLRA